MERPACPRFDSHVSGSPLVSGIRLPPRSNAHMGGPSEALVPQLRQPAVRSIAFMALRSDRFILPPVRCAGRYCDRESTGEAGKP
jgi:hypothetical protein